MLKLWSYVKATSWSPLALLNFPRKIASNDWTMCQIASPHISRKIDWIWFYVFFCFQDFFHQTKENPSNLSVFVIIFREFFFAPVVNPTQWKGLTAPRPHQLPASAASVANSLTKNWYPSVQFLCVDRWLTFVSRWYVFVAYIVPYSLPKYHRRTFWVGFWGPNISQGVRKPEYRSYMQKFDKKGD